MNKFYKLLKWILPLVILVAQIPQSMGQSKVASCDATSSGSHAIWFKDYGNFLFQNDGMFTKYDNGTAMLTGTIQSTKYPTWTFDVSVNFSDYTDQANHKPKTSKYTDPAEIPNWVYYESFSGTFTGTGAIDGLVLAISLRGVPFQQGLGANDKTADYGASAWFNFAVASPAANSNIDFKPGVGDFNLNLACTMCTDQVDGGTVAMPSGATVRYTCPGDGVDDVVTATHVSSSAANYAYVVTDPNGTILGLPPGNEVNVEGAGEGTCLIWGLSYTGNLQVAAGDNALTSMITDGCFELSSNYITIERDEPEAGMVSLAGGGTTAYTCPGDGTDDVVMAAHEGASRSKYAYIVTDPDGNVLGLPPGNEVNVEGAGVGTCLIWGVAYTGEITIMPGENANTTALSSDCYDLSDNFVTIERDEPEAGMVSLAGGGTIAYTCPGDGTDDVVMAAHEGASRSKYAYIVTDPDGNVLGLPPGNEVNVEGAGVGTCLIWGVAYTGEITIMPGENANTTALSSDCYDLSDNFVTIERDEPEAGMVSLAGGGTTAYTCPGDGTDDVVMAAHEGASRSKYAYIVTDPDGNVLGLPPGNEVNVEGAGVGTCLIWGVAYTGEITIMPGENANTTPLSSDCYDLSDNFVTIERDEPEAGMVSLAGGGTTAYTCPGDGTDDVVMAAHEGASRSKYAYIVTDPDGNVLGLPPGNEVNVEGAGVGTCLIWGVAYTGEITIMPGENANTTALSSDCYDLSDNFVTIERDEPEAGALASNGETTVNTCPGDGTADYVVVDIEGASRSNYGLVLTDTNNVILNIVMADSVNFEGAGEGVCRIWGVSFTGQITVAVGDTVKTDTQLSDDCFDLSENYITVNRVNSNCSSGRPASSKISVGAYPNPLNDILTLTFDSQQSIQSADIRFLDLSGKTVLSETRQITRNRSEFHLNETGVGPGFYIVKVVTDSGENGAIRIHKMR